MSLANDVLTNYYEAAYNGNVGMMEMMRFWQLASEMDKKRMKEILALPKSSDTWNVFKELIKKVVGITLK